MAFTKSQPEIMYTRAIIPATRNRVTKLVFKLNYNVDQSNCKEIKIATHFCEEYQEYKDQGPYRLIILCDATVQYIEINNYISI